VTKDANLKGAVIPLTATIVVGWVAIGLAVLFIMRPLGRRIERLRHAAERVGDEEGYTELDEASEDDVGAVAGSLDRAHHRIREDANRLKERQRALERHLDDVAHDLRTPLASLQLSLEQAADATDDPETSALLVGALRDLVYVSGLTDDLRLATQLRDGWDPAASGATVAIEETVERVVARARALARRRGIELEVAVPDGTVPVRCDPIAAEQAIANVLQNSIAYGDRGGHVAVLLERAGARFSLQIVDDGPGVAPSELPRLGERTFRSDEARQRDPRGSGLGLAITTEVCARCSWNLRFVNEEPRGLRVAIEGAIAPKR